MRLGNVKIAFAAFFIGFIIISRVASATLLSMEIQITGTPSQIYYSATLIPSFFPGDSNPQDLQFQTGLISSSDGQYTATGNSPGVWNLKEPVFNNFNSFISSLEQPWNITLDAGLSSQRLYTMSLDVGALATANFVPPVITFPQNQSTISPGLTTFTFTPPTPQNSVFLQLEHLPNHATVGSYVFDDQLSLPAGATQWSPSSPLIPQTQYYMDLLIQNIFPQNFAFSDPTDSQGKTIPNWSSNGNVTLESDSFFATGVPEPGFISILIAAIPIFTRSRLRLISSSNA